MTALDRIDQAVMDAIEGRRPADRELWQADRAADTPPAPRFLFTDSIDVPATADPSPLLEDMSDMPDIPALLRRALA